MYRWDGMRKVETSERTWTWTDFHMSFGNGAKEEDGGGRPPGVKNRGILDVLDEGIEMGLLRWRAKE